MKTKACLLLLIALSPATLFAGETVVKRKPHHVHHYAPAKCDFRVDKCETSVATDPSYAHFQDNPSPRAPIGSNSVSGDPSRYQESFTFVDFSSTALPSIDELLAQIGSSLSNCPEVALDYDEDTGDLTVTYPKSACGCEWVVNVRGVKADSFVIKPTSDNYSPYLGQLEREKFHCKSEQDAQKIQTACQQICKLNNWSKY